MGFIEDMKKVSAEAACALRTKSANANKRDRYKKYHGYYSSEAEFVAEVYRELVFLDKRYLDTLHINYYIPKPKQRSLLRVLPDIVQNSPNGGRTVVEVKAVWFTLEGGDGLYKVDSDRITKDYEKLRDKYKSFDYKILLVSFLGEPEDYHRNKFHSLVQELVHGKSSIEVITC